MTRVLVAEDETLIRLDLRGLLEAAGYEVCAEARDGEEVRPGLVLVAPAGRHLTFHRDGSGKIVTRLDVRPLDTTHRPSVDVLFQSAADAYSGRVLGVVMTGMGEDGREGAAWIKAKGGTVVTEAEESCVVYGMPRAAEQRGALDCQLPLPEIISFLEALA